VVWLTACAPSPTTDVASPSPSGEAESPSPTSPGESETLGVDQLAEVLVEDLRLRAAPGLNAESLGLLPAGEPAYVVAGPRAADGYEWYQLASVREPYRSDCGEPAPPALECSWWFGWAAAITPEGDPWLAPLDPGCPSDRDTGTYIALTAATRLACAGPEEWHLVAYLAPEAAGRGCGPTVWTVIPAWLGGCSLIFPQPEERQFDEVTVLHVVAHPSLGNCSSGDMAACPFEALKGSWVEMVGHLDDPAAATCESALTFWFESATPPPQVPPPDPDQVVFSCRLAFVVTEVRAAAAPDG
jgi:hypothetical protein